MYKKLSLLVLLALAAVVLATETQDQATAEQFFRVNGFYPSWYLNNAAYYNGVRNYPYTYGVNPYGFTAGAYPAYSAYNGFNAFRSYPAGYGNGYSYYY